MIDTHCHLYEESILPSLDEVLHRAKEAGVTQILLPNIDVDSWEPLLKVLNNPIIPCSPMLGLHPCYVKEDVNDQMNTLAELLKTHHEQLVAIGEIGMDLYWDKQFLTEQKQALNQQIEWALSYKLPIAIHVRDAFDPLFEVLSDYQISIPEIGTIQARSKPMVFLTSNDTRDLSDALKRRCLHLHIPFPSIELESRIVTARVPELESQLSDQLVRFVHAIRELDLKKSPAISETLDWARSLVLLHANQLDSGLVHDTLNVLLKYEEDIVEAEGQLGKLLKIADGL